MVMASDGVWDVLTNQEVIEFIQTTANSLVTTYTNTNTTNSSSNNTSSYINILNTDYIAQISDKLLERALERGSVDNMSVIIIWFNYDLKHPLKVLNTVHEDEEEVEVEGEKEWISELNATAKKLFINED